MIFSVFTEFWRRRRAWVSLPPWAPAAALFFLGVVAAAPARALTLQQLETQVRTLVRDTSVDTNYQRFSTAQIDAFLNEAQRQMQNDAWLYQGSFSMDITSGTMEYPLPSDFITAVRVTISSVALTQVSFQGLDQDNVNWTLSMSTPTEYFIDPYVSSAPANIGFYRNPKYTTSGGAVFMQYIRQVPTLVNETDVPFGNSALLFPYHDALADFAAARCWQLLGRNDLAQGLMEIYTSRAKQARANLNNQPNFLPGATGARNSTQAGDQP